jgi:hypothetical protein
VTLCQCFKAFQCAIHRILKGAFSGHGMVKIILQFQHKFMV